MTHAQKGAYVDLLSQQWDDPLCSLPARLSELKALIHWNGTDEEFKLVRACFVTHPDQPGKLSNARLYLEWQKAEEKRQAAKASAQTRWQKPPSNGPSKPPSTPIRTNTDRTSKGFEPAGSEIAKIADKWFPPP